MGLRNKATKEWPVGTIWMFQGTTPPPGWLLCDGGSTAGYGKLAAQVGANVPDLRGRLPMGAGTGTGLTARALGATPGAETVSLGTGNMPSHAHGGGAHTHGLHGHTHTGGLHGHAGAGAHVHGMGHDHGPHAHGGTVMVGNGGFHLHNNVAGEASSYATAGYWTGIAVSSNNAYAGYNAFNSGGPSGFGNEAPETGGPNSVGAGGAASPVNGQGASTAFGIDMPSRAVTFIIKT